MAGQETNKKQYVISMFGQNTKNTPESGRDLVPIASRPSAPIAPVRAASTQGPLVTSAPGLENVLLDRNDRATLRHTAQWVQELRDLGLNASQKIEGFQHESLFSEKLLPKKIQGFLHESFFGEKLIRKGLKSSILVNGRSHDISWTFQREHFGAVSKDTLSYALSMLTFANVAGSCTLVTTGLDLGLILAGMALSPVLGAVGTLGYAVWKTGSLREGWNMMRDYFAGRPLSYNIRHDLVKSVFGQLSREADFDTTITLSPQRKNALLKDLTAHAATIGYTVRAILPDGEISVPEARRIVKGTTLGEVVAERTPVKPVPTLPKPDETQKGWTDKLYVAFNAFSGAVQGLDPGLRAQASGLLATVQSIETLCREARVTNTNIGRAAHELENLTTQVEAYHRLVRIGAAQPQDAQGLGEIFAIKAKSLIERFEPEFREVRGRFEIGQELLRSDLI